MSSIERMAGRMRQKYLLEATGHDRIMSKSRFKSEYRMGRVLRRSIRNCMATDEYTGKQLCKMYCTKVDYLVVYCLGVRSQHDAMAKSGAPVSLSSALSDRKFQMSINVRYGIGG